MGAKLYDMSDWCKRGPKITNYPYMGEIDKAPELFEVITIGGHYYSPCLLAADKSYAGVNKVNFKTCPVREEYTNQLTCPFCGYEDYDSWELDDSEDKHECGQCGGVMAYERVVTVEYISSPVEAPKAVKANWIREEV